MTTIHDTGLRPPTHTMLEVVRSAAVPFSGRPRPCVTALGDAAFVSFGVCGVSCSKKLPGQLFGTFGSGGSYVDPGFGVAPPPAAFVSFGVCGVSCSKKLPGQLFGTFGSEGPHDTTFGLRGRVGPLSSQKRNSFGQSELQPPVLG